MILVNANSQIYIEDFYSGEIYLLDINTMRLDKAEQAHAVDSIGYIAFESCGLFEKKYKIFALFCYEAKPYLLIDNQIIDIKEERLKIVFRSFLPFIQELTIYRNDKKFYCKRWSKDIDEFSMDDFFYFLEFSFKQDFNNLCLDVSND